MPNQIYNNELIRLLGSKFVKSGNPFFSWARAASAFMYLPGLRGLWLHAAADSSRNLRDSSGVGLTFTASGSPSVGQSENLVAFTSYASGSSQYHYFTHSADVNHTGGITVGGWFRFDAVVAQQGCISKYPRWGLFLDNPTSEFIFGISDAGAGFTDTVTHNSGPVADTWYFVVGRYVPSTSIDVYADTVKVSNTTSIPAAMQSAETNQMRIGNLTGTDYLNGDASLTFFCTVALDDFIIKAMYENTRHLFK